MIWNIDWPAYGPNGGWVADACSPRTSLPTSAVSVPDDCVVPPMRTMAVRLIVSEKSNALKGGGGSADGAGEGGDSVGGEPDDTGGGERERGDGMGGGGDEVATALPVSGTGASAVPISLFTTTCLLSTTDVTHAQPRY